MKIVSLKTKVGAKPRCSSIFTFLLERDQPFPPQPHIKDTRALHNRFWYAFDPYGMGPITCGLFTKYKLNCVHLRKSGSISGLGVRGRAGSIHSVVMIVPIEFLKIILWMSKLFLINRASSAF